MFDDAFEVKSERVPIHKIFQDLNKDLELSDDLKVKLESFHKSIRNKFSNIYQKFDDTSFITKGTSDSVNYGGPLHRRAQFHGLSKGFVVSKGSGYNNWQEDESFAGVPLHYDKCNSKVKFPIVRKFLHGKNDCLTHAYIGGMNKFFANFEFTNGLLLAYSCKKAGVKIQPSIPICVTKPMELPLVFNDKVKIVNQEEYCKFNYSLRRKGRNINEKEFKNLRIFNYVSQNPIKRIKSLMTNESERLGLEFSDSKRYEIVKNFSERFASTIAAAHLNRGVFTELHNNGKISSLSCNNVTISGEILDWDTIYFGETCQKYFESDLSVAHNTLRDFSISYDIFDKKSENYSKYKACVNRYKKKSSKKIDSVINGELKLNDYSIDTFKNTYKEIFEKNGIEPIYSYSLQV